MFDHLSMLPKCESYQRLHGLSGVRIDYPCSSWPLGGSETGMESSTSKDAPCQISEAFRFHLPLLEPHFHLSSFFPLFPLFFSFGSAVTTASSSSSTPATASSLTFAQYLIRANYIAVLIRPLGCHL